MNSSNIKTIGNKTEKVLALVCILIVLVGGTLKLFFHKPLGGVLFFSGLAIWFFLSAIEFPWKKEFKPDLKSKSANAKLFKQACFAGAFLIIVGAILKILHIQIGRAHV